MTTMDAALVAVAGIAHGPRRYERLVQLYTTPHADDRSRTCIEPPSEGGARPIEHRQHQASATGIEPVFSRFVAGCCSSSASRTEIRSRGDSNAHTSG